MSKHNIQFDVEADAARAGFHKKRLPPDFRQVQWSLQCAKCPELFHANWPSGMKPEAMMTHMRRRQWDVGYGMRPLCPKCAFSKNVSPAKKPEHQNFERWVPPPTKIFDALLTAANKRATDERVAHAIEVVMDMDQAVADAKEETAVAKWEKRQTRATEAEEQRKARTRERISMAQKARWDRIKQTKIASDEALRIAQLKELHDMQQRERNALCGTTDIMRGEITHFHITPQEAPQAEKEVANMLTSPTKPTPSPKITHAVFQLLDACFDPAKRLYKSGYTDQRVARDCGTSEEVVAYLRTETFGALAEDPRIGSIRDDIELLGMDAAEKFAALQKSLGELRSRVEQIARK